MQEGDGRRQEAGGRRQEAGARGRKQGGEPGTDKGVVPAACSCLLPSAVCRLPPFLSRSEKDLQDSFLGGALHGQEAISQGIFFTYQAVDVDGAVLQQIERGCQSTAT